MRKNVLNLRKFNFAIEFKQMSSKPMNRYEEWFDRVFSDKTILSDQKLNTMTNYIIKSNIKKDRWLNKRFRDCINS